MKPRWIHCWMLAVLMATALSVLSIGAPGQNAGPGNDGKSGAESSFEGEIMDNDCAQMGSHDATMKANTLSQPELCVLYCLYFKKTPGRRVLYNSATKTIYELDDQDLSQFFIARKVKVFGTYDPATKIIHVKDIQSVPESENNNSSKQ